MKINFKCDGTKKIGKGHIARCLTLGKGFLKEGHEVSFYSNIENSSLIEEIKHSGILYYPTPITASKEDLAQLSSYPREECFWILDSYAIDDEYIQKIKAGSLGTMIFDDENVGWPHADLLLSLVPGTGSEGYRKDPRLIQGDTFLIKENLQHIKRERSFKEETLRVFLFMGGADSKGLTEKILGMIDPLHLNIQLEVVIGEFNPQKANLEKEYLDIPQINIRGPLKDFGTEMMEMDIAIISGGQIAFELAYLGLPSLILSVAKNQDATGPYLEEKGCALSLGGNQNLKASSLEAKIKKLQDLDLRQKMSQSGKALIDGQGRERIIQAILNWLGIEEGKGDL